MVRSLRTISGFKKSAVAKYIWTLIWPLPSLLHSYLSITSGLILINLSMIGSHASTEVSVKTCKKAVNVSILMFLFISPGATILNGLEMPYITFAGQAHSYIPRRYLRRNECSKGNRKWALPGSNTENSVAHWGWFCENTAVQITGKKNPHLPTGRWGSIL